MLDRAIFILSVNFKRIVMKNSLGIALAVFLLIWSNETQAQFTETTINQITKEFKGNASGTIGFIGTTKIRLQYELPIKKVLQLA
jgi:hypothetical protein